MSEILTREYLMEDISNLTYDAILAHDAALRLALAEATREWDEARALAVSWEREFNGANHERLRLWDEAENLREKVGQFEAAGFPNVASVLDRIAVLSRARETDGAVREAAEKFRIALADTAGCDCPWDACDHWRPVTEAAYATANAVLSALSSPPRPETKDTVMAPSMFGAGLLVPTRPMAVTDAPPADAATEAVRPDGVVLADFLRRNALAADACHNCKSDDCECISAPAPAPSKGEPDAD